MARRLVEVGDSLSRVHDIGSTRTRALAEELGCLPASTPAAHAHIIITVVTDDDAMNRLFDEQDPESLIACAEGRIFLNCGTVSPAVHRAIERRVTARGGRTLEACMAGSLPQARAGTLYFLCGGSLDTFDAVKPVLESLGSTLRYIGPAGEAAKVKALVNMVMNCNTAALAEGLGLGPALGLDLHMLREVFAQTGAASRVLETDADDMIQHECFFSARHAAKDSGVALELAAHQHLNLPVAQATFSQYCRLIESGKGDWDKSAIAELTFPPCPRSAPSEPQ